MKIELKREVKADGIFFKIYKNGWPEKAFMVTDLKNEIKVQHEAEDYFLFLANGGEKTEVIKSIEV